MSHQIAISPLTAEAFAPFGDVMDAKGPPTLMINNGNCARHSDQATLDFDQRGSAGISIFNAQPYRLPHTLSLVERHPLGSQAFIPMSGEPYLAIVAEDHEGKPQTPLAFLVDADTAINIHRNVWHGVLTPLNSPALFAVVDWIGQGDNLQEYHFPTPWIVNYRPS